MINHWQQEGDSSNVLYTVSNVSQIYKQRTVLSVDQLNIDKGEILALVGPSGAGKSTLLRLLGFLEMPAFGTLTYQSQPIPPNLETRREVTLVFQRPQMLRRSVRDNINYGLQLRGFHNGTHQNLFDEITEQLGLTSLLDAFAPTLSGGEIQRVALARALVLQPKVLLLDEPTANLDPYNINLIEQMVQYANETHGTTVVIVTHNIFQAKRLAHRVGLLLNGKLVEIAGTSTFFDAPTNPQTAAFVRGDLVY
jgi:tungstate transport system ATP-binding protein